MTQLLLIKTSSLGDVIHALPAVTDASHFRPEIRIDWLVEENFAEIPKLHPHVNHTYTVAIRRWRKHWWQSKTRHEVMHQISTIRHTPYNLSVDCQGLLKSAVLAKLLPGYRHGYDQNSIREPLASLFYQQTHCVSWQLHAVERNRQLIGQVLGYTPPTKVEYGITAPPLEAKLKPHFPFVLFLHGTSRQSKEWPTSQWIRLGEEFAKMGLIALLPSGNPTESERAHYLAQQIKGAIALPSLNLTQLASLLSEARYVIGVDTGLTHLATALKQKVVAIYTDTDPDATGVYGNDLAHNVGGIGMMPTVESILELCL